MIKLICIKCKKERELTDDEIEEVGDFITNKNMKATSILKYFNLVDGETCGDREHKYGWDSQFLNQITEKTSQIKELDNKIKQNMSNIRENIKKIDELKIQNNILENEYKEMDNKYISSDKEIQKETGIKWDKWC